jgi:hypothetical protein
LVEDGEVDGWNPEVGGRCRSGEVRGLGDLGEVVEVVMAGELEDAFLRTPRVDVTDDRLARPTR